MAETINNFGRTAVRAIAQNLYMQKKVPESISSKSNGTADAGISIDFQGYTFDATEYNDIDSHKVASNIQLPLASAGEKKEQLYEDIFNC